MKWLVALLITASLSYATPGPDCETKLGGHGQSLITIVEKAFDARILRLEDLKLFASSEAWFNPFEGNAGLTAPMYRRAFSELERNLPNPDKAAVKKRMAVWIAKQTEDANVAEEAHAQTTRMLTLKPQASGKIDDLIEMTSRPPILGRLEGRPVLIMPMMQLDALEQITYYISVFDPFNSESDKKLVKFFSGRLYTESPYYFSASGGDYLACLDDQKIFDLKTRKNVFASFTGRKIPDPRIDDNVETAVPTPYLPGTVRHKDSTRAFTFNGKVYAVWAERGRLVVADSETQTELKTSLEVGLPSQMKIFEFENRIYAIVSGDEKIQLIELVGPG